MDAVYKFRGSVHSDLKCVKSFLESALSSLNHYIYDEELLFEIRLILDELVINGVLHGNESDWHKKVYLNVTLSEDSVIIKVRDEGSGVVYQEEAYDPLDLKTSGRGLIIVQALTDDLILQDNQVIAIKKF